MSDVVPVSVFAGGPSEAAVEAARREWHRHELTHPRTATEKALAAAHDPGLGLERSVRLGDVIDVLRREYDAYLQREGFAPVGMLDAADHLLSVFGAVSPFCPSPASRTEGPR